MQIRNFNAESGPKAAGGYCQALAVENAKTLLFISGQIPENEQGIVPQDFTSQARQVWHNVLAQLAAADMTVHNLVKVTIFLSSRDFAIENRDVRNEFLAGHACALTVIITGIFDESWLLEIEAIAAK